MSRKAIAALVAGFPQSFELRGYRGVKFRIDAYGSYINKRGEAMLSLQRLVRGVWGDATLHTEAYVRAEIVKLIVPRISVT